MKVKYSKQFLKDVAKLKKSQADQLRNRIQVFLTQPEHPTLNNHSLKGMLKDYRAINISGDLRAIFKIETNPAEVRFVRLGTHSTLY